MRTLLAALALATMSTTACAQEDADAPPTVPPDTQPEAQPDAPAADEATPDVTPLAHVETRGEGPTPMILIPSLWCDWSVYDDFMERNRERYTMYAVTFPGYAGSDPPPEPADPYDFVGQPWRTNAINAILQLIETESIEQPVVVGHYSGGQLAIRIAIEHPDVVRAAVSIEGPLAFPIGGTPRPIPRQDRDNAVRRMAAERVPQEFWERVVRDNAGMLVTNPGRAVLLGDMMATAPFNVAKRYWIEATAEDLWNRVTGLKVPLLVVVAIAQETPVEERVQLRKQWDQAFSAATTATLVYVDDSRQFVMFDQPQVLDDAIVKFLSPPVESPDEEGGEDQ